MTAFIFTSVGVCNTNMNDSDFHGEYVCTSGLYVPCRLLPFVPYELDESGTLSGSRMTICGASMGTLCQSHSDVCRNA